MFETREEMVDWRARIRLAAIIVALEPRDFKFS